MKRIQHPSLRGRVLLFAGVCCLLQLGTSRQASAQATGTRALQTNVVTGLGCAPSNNGTGHMICAEELSNPTSGGPTLLGGVSWQVPNTDGVNPAPHTVPGTNGMIETANTVDQITSITLPGGPFTGTPGCAKTNDNPLSGFVICAFQGTNNGLFGIAIHPQVTTSDLEPVELLTPGQVITTPFLFTDSPCTPASPCNVFTSVAGIPSCATTEGNMVICGVVALMQNNVGTAFTTLLGVAFDPRMPLTTATTGVGANPAVLILQNGGNFTTDPSCTDDMDKSGGINGGKGFAACAIGFQNNFFNATATMFGVSFDPRTHTTGVKPYNPGGLVVGATATTLGSSYTGVLDFNDDPSCATPRDNKGEFTCVIGVGIGNGGTTGTSSVLLGVTFFPVSRAAAVTQNLGAAPSGAWSGVSCASPNDANDTNSVACVATTGTTDTTTHKTIISNTMHAINFDPRTGTDPTTNAAPAWSSFTFSDPDNANATPTSLPSCVSENIDNNQISCGIVDSAGNSVGFYTDPH